VTVDATETDEILAGMFTENTGSHMLDSGGAYGRNWERNRDRTVEDFLTAPEVYLQHNEFVVVDAFHWLRERVEYDPIMDRKFQLWDALFFSDNRTGWLEVMESFADAHRNRGGRDYLNGTYNTYNGDDSLSQTLQFTIFTDPFGIVEYVLLQVHGGCDVRGGYTAPRAFRIAGESADMLDWDVYTLACQSDRSADPLPGMPGITEHILDRRNGEWTTYEGSYEADPWNNEEWTAEKDGETFIRCPYCIEPTPMGLYPAVVS
jgi:hypothetical protein